MHLEVAERAAERDVAVAVEAVLVAEEDHLPLEQRGADLRDRLGRQVVGEVDPADLGADRRGHRFDGDGHGAERMTRRPGRASRSRPDNHRDSGRVVRLNPHDSAANDPFGRCEGPGRSVGRVRIRSGGPGEAESPCSITHHVIARARFALVTIAALGAAVFGRRDRRRCRRGRSQPGDGHHHQQREPVGQRPDGHVHRDRSPARRGSRPARSRRTRTARRTAASRSTRRDARRGRTRSRRGPRRPAATYQGSSVYAVGSSPTLTQTTNPAATTTVVTSSANPSSRRRVGDAHRDEHRGRAGNVHRSTAAPSRSTTALTKIGIEVGEQRQGRVQHQDARAGRPRHHRDVPGDVEVSSAARAR